MKCQKCGYPLPEDSEFCQYCGVRLETQLPSDIPSGAETSPTKVVLLTEPIVSKPVSEAVCDSTTVSPRPTQGETPITPTNKQSADSQANNKQRYCKLCGQPVDSATKKCAGCGKQYFKAKLSPLYVVLAVLFLLVGYISVNYFSAVSAMNEEKFIEAKQYFDNLFISETVFPSKYAYVEAGVLLEKGDYINSLKAFNKVEGIPVPASIINSLESKIYSAGQKAYREGKLIAARANFKEITGYKRSNDYLLLIECCSPISFSNGSSLSKLISIGNYEKLIKLLGFENADEIILMDSYTSELFLDGRWEARDTRLYFFELFEEDVSHSCRYNLPHKTTTGYYYLSDGVYSEGQTEETAVKQFKFSIIDEDTISVYCYKDGSTYKLYRQ